MYCIPHNAILHNVTAARRRKPAGLRRPTEFAIEPQTHDRVGVAQQRVYDYDSR